MLWPSSQNVPYDIMVDNDVTTLKIQIKATYVKSNAGKADSYKVNTTKVGDRPYLKSDCDLIACYIYHTNTWYIIPIDVACGKTSMLFYPHREGEKVGQYEQFRDAFHLLKG